MKTLIAVAKELSKVMALEPTIKVVGITKVALLEKIKEASTFIQKEDKFTEETVTFLKEKKFWPKFKTEKVEEKEEPAAEEKPEEKKTPAKKKKVIAEEKEEVKEKDTEVKLSEENEELVKAITKYCSPVSKCYERLRNLIKDTVPFASIPEEVVNVFNIEQLANAMLAEIGAKPIIVNGVGKGGSFKTSKSKEKRESYVDLGRRMVREEADAKTIKRAFIRAYNLQGVTNMIFINRKIKNYVEGARKELEAK